MSKVLGSDLRVGDTLAVWWGAGRDTITSIRPYTGSLNFLFPKGAAIAEFALNKTGMTIDKADLYEVVGRMSEAA